MALRFGSALGIDADAGLRGGWPGLVEAET
jgi:hypothetical protein